MLRQLQFSTMSAIARVRGMMDLGEAALRRRAFIEAAFATVTNCYQFVGLQTPIVEPAQLFSRSLGAASELVRKEMFLLTSRGGDSEASLALRPEGTLPAIRSMIESGAVRTLPHRVRYTGPFFRYERPQKGRLRQFTQCGVEALASKSVAGEDAELIAMASRFLDEIGVRSALQLRVNSLGTPQCRAKYESQALVPFFTAHRGELSEASQTKLADGRALRILDSSDAADVEVVRAAPSLMSALDAASRHRFDRVRSALGALGVEHVLDERLVRGLDYYTHTIFEFVNDDKLGRQQRTALAGGRYDGVVGALDGPKHVASFGWAAGVERLEILMQELHGDFAEPSDPIVAVISARGAAVAADDDGGADDDAPIGPGEMAALQLCEQLRAQNFVVAFEHSGSLRRQLNRANKLGAVAAVIVGDDEVEQGILKLRDMATGEETEYRDDFDALVEALRDRATPGEFEELGSDVMMEALQAHLKAQQEQQANKN